MNGPDDDLRAWLIALRTPGLGPGGLREALASAGGRIGAAGEKRLVADAIALGIFEQGLAQELDVIVASAPHWSTCAAVPAR